MATEQVSLFGLVIVGARHVPYGKIHPDEAGDIFIRSALVDGDIHRPFPFMVHNQNLIEELEEAEHKTRQRDILVGTEDMVRFYHDRLPRPFHHLKTFAKFLKDQKDDQFLRMTREDLERNRADQDRLALFPDMLKTEQGHFALSYRFNPGDDEDGITVKVPADMAAQIPRTAVEKLVPGCLKKKSPG